METKITAIFDIGKTNKKFFPFDNKYQEIYREYIYFEETKDEDGCPTEDLKALHKTGSPNLGILNAGMQLCWLKYTKSEIFKRIKFSLHLPQYLSYIFTGIPISEYTGIGCHTGLWDYEKKIATLGFIKKGSIKFYPSFLQKSILT